MKSLCIEGSIFGRLQPEHPPESTRVLLLSSAKCMQIKEIRRSTAHSGYSARRKPFGRMGFQRTIRTRRALRTLGKLAASGTIPMPRTMRHDLAS